MSLFIAGAIAGASLLAGFLVAISEQIRVRLKRRREASDPQFQAAWSARVTPARRVGHSAQPVTDEERAAAYHEILDALGDDLDQEIAEWEGVLQEFPQVIGAEEFHWSDERPREPIVRTADAAAAELPRSEREPMTSPPRTRRISVDEQGMIQRLLKTGFAPEEIALWLDLPLERVQEFLLRDK
jgi:hypothetical protein